MNLSRACLWTVLASSASSTSASRPRAMELPQERRLRADSDIGRHLLSQARRVEDAGVEEAEEEQAWQMDLSWMGSYSLKFQGCHYVQQFFDQDGEGGGEKADNGAVQMQRLVRFRLCPSNRCSDNKSEGCSNKYGDYVVGLNTFVNAYYEFQQRQDEYECELYLQNNCNCEDDGNQGDDFNAERCEYDCFVEAGLENQCAENNPYEEEGEGQRQEEWFNAERYMQCAEFEMNQDGANGGERRLEDANGGGSGLFIGPYCSEQGGAIYLGGFTDETCTTFADQKSGRTTFKALTGEALPYSTENIVRSDKCMSCTYNADMEEGGEEAGNGQGAQVAELCENLYYPAGKCEQKLPSGTASERNNYACAYIDSVKSAFQQDGVAHAKSANGGTSFFLALLIVATMGLGLYVYYLRTRLAIQKESIKAVLLEDGAHQKQEEIDRPTITVS